MVSAQNPSFIWVKHMEMTILPERSPIGRRCLTFKDLIKILTIFAEGLITCDVIYVT